MTVETIHNAAIVLDNEEAERLEFQVFPDTITDAKTVNWADINIVGRSEPIRSYANSTARMFSYTLSFVASVDQSDAGQPLEVKNKTDFLQSLTYPQITEHGIVTNPPVVFLIVGDLINSRCLVRQVSTQWMGPWHVAQDPTPANVAGPVSPFLPYFSLPMIAQTSIVMEEVNILPHDSLAVRQHRRLAGGAIAAQMQGPTL